MRIDGQPVELHRITLALPGFRATPGSREATLSFEPPAWTSLTVLLSLIGWTGSLGCAAFLRFGPAPKKWKMWWEGEELEIKTPEEKVFSKQKEERVQGVAAKIQKFLIILSAHKARERLQHVLEEVQVKVEGVEILVVDDNSADGIAAMVKKTPAYGKKVNLLERPNKAESDFSRQEGFQWALKRGYDAVVEMDADLSYEPGDVPKLIQALNEGADMAVGSRYLEGVRVLNWPQSRLWMSLCAGWFVRLLTGVPMTDPASGFHAIRRRVVEGFDLNKSRAKEHGLQIEIHCLAWQRGFRLQEVPVVFTGRQEGHSKISLQIVREAALPVLQLALRRVFP